MASTDTRPRSQSITVAQTWGSHQSRTSKVFQQVSNIKGRLRFLGRKPKDERDMNPYPTQTRSMDMHGEAGVKPYMSHPALNMVVQPLNHRYHRSMDSSAPASRSHSPSRSESRKPIEVVELPQSTHGSPQSLPRNSIPLALMPGMRTGAVPSSRSMDRRPYNPGSRSQPLSRPSTSTSVTETTIKPKPTPVVISDPSESTLRTQSISQPSTSSGTPITNVPNNTGLSQGRVLARSHSRKRLKDLPDTPSSHLPTSSSQSPAPSAVLLPPPPPSKPTTITYASSQPLLQLPHQSQSKLPTPSSFGPSTITYSSSLPQVQPTTQPTHQRHSTEPPVLHASTNPRLRDPAPKLSLNRLSLTMPDGYSARFSPSIVMRTPPLPMLSLPPLPAIPSSPSSSATRQGRVGLRNMPELPHQGTDLRDDGDDEDEEGEEEGDEEDDEEQENDTETLRDGSSIYHDFDSPDEQHRRPVETDIGVGLKPSLSSVWKTHFRSSSYGQNEYSGLPEVDLSHIDLDLSFLDNPPPSSSGNLKGKGKAQSLAPDNERTPTSTSMPHDYFSDRPGVEKKRERDRDVERYRAQTEQPQLQAEGLGRARKDTNILPTRTPRGGNTPVRMALSPAANPLASRSVSPRPPAQDSLAPLSHQLTQNLDINVGLRIRPEMYKQASHSLIDIHAAEKKEMVEGMVRDAEQEAVVEEKARRRRSVMMSGKGKGKGKVKESVDRNSSVGVLHPPPPSPAELVHDVEGEGSESKRMTKPPAFETGPHRLRRRRSMPSFIAISDPPPYPAFERRANTYGLPAQLYIQPRDDEGRERLPKYSNDIYLKSIVPRKMEFVAAGVQAKDRKWRRVVCVLEGTALKVYHCPANVAGLSALSGWWERKVGVGDVYVAAGSTGASGSGSAAAREREREEGGRIQKGGDGLGQAELHVPASSHVSSSPPLQRQAHPPSTSSSRSRLGLVNLLRPTRTHVRSTSDMQTPPRPRSPRASLNIPVGAGGSELSSRSHSPSTPSSESTLSLSSHNSNSQSQSVSSGQTSASSSRSPFRTAQRGNSNGSTDPDPNPADLIKAYTMQHAESGLGNDYLKRKNVIRVRVEGEQFLFQAKDVADVVKWIEGLQAAANVSLDLDERPMPKGPLFPRRRRRRGARRTENDSGPVNIALSR